MKTLITAGSTQTPIDSVRCITNIFTGQTGARIALEALTRNHQVTFLTSHPEVIRHLSPELSQSPLLRMMTYQSFEDLEELMGHFIPQGNYQAIIHAAAVSDYKVAGVYSDPLGPPLSNTGKLPSSADTMWLKMERTPKLVDRIRHPWQFAGTLIKFKLEVNITEEELKHRAEKALQQSHANYVVANRLETAQQEAFLLRQDGTWQRIERNRLATSILDLLC